MAYWPCEHVSQEPLKPAASGEEYALHLAALEWSLAEPIIITGRGDIKSEANWRGRFEPYEHQVQNLITFCRRLPVTLLADDVGLGKTISAGFILSELIERKRIGRALVICPAILGPQWEEELEGKFRIKAKFATGAAFDGDREHSGAPVLITTYDTARRRIGNLHTDEFGMLVLDEAHKLRNLYGTQNPPLVARSVCDALRTRVFKYVLMLTATPIQNRVWDLYSLIDLLTVAKGHRNPLGSPSEFQRAYLNDAAGRRLNPFRADQFRSILRQYVVRTRREDARLQFPTREVVMRKLEPTDVEDEMQDLVAEHIGQMNALAQVSISQAMMSSPQALAAQLENMAGRDPRLRSAAAATRELANRNPRTAKLLGLLALMHELRQQRPRDWRLIVFTMRRETQAAIGTALEAEGVSTGYIRGGQARENHATVCRFRTDPPAVNVIVSTDAGAEGVNLQSGNVLVNYDLPWNPMIVEQRIGRVQRLGTTHERVIITNLAVAGSVEERVVARLLEKLQVIAHTIGDIETILEAAGQEDEGSFEEMIRELVVRSLQGADVEEAARLKTASIERAKEQMESERQNIDAVFGNESSQPVDALHPPKVERVQPSMRPEDFVMKALAAEGALIRPRADDTFDVIRAGGPLERITFKPEAAEAAPEGVFMGNAPKLYLPGRPPFERLVQRWLDRSGHHVRDLSCDMQGKLHKTAADWCNTVPDAVFKNAQLLGRTSRGELKLVCRGKAANGVDSLEKILTIAPSGTSDHLITPEDVQRAPVLDKAATAQDIAGGIDSHVEQVVAGDADIAAFCQFYDARLREELGNAGGEASRRHKIEADLAPKVFAEVVGMSGYRYDLAKARVWFLLDQRHEYAAEIEVLPATGRVLVQPPRRECTVTGRSLPEPCLARCEISGALATAHLLVQSAESGRRALPQYAVTCAVSNATLLEDEVGMSAISGKKAGKKHFKASPISDRQGMAEDFEQCGFSGTYVLVDELETSAISGRKHRMDQGAVCAITGKKGHAMEFVRCEQTGQTVLGEHTDLSAISGMRVRRDILVRSDKPPHRLALDTETVACAKTGRRLLRDEAETSAVSSRLFDADLLAASDLSGRKALPEELQECEDSHRHVLPEECVTCSITGKRVARDLVSMSEVSNRPALGRLLVRCESTRKLVLPEELSECELTGKRVLPIELGVCSISHKRVLKDRLLTSDVSGATMLPEHVVRSPMSKRVCLPQEAAMCEWLGQRMPQDELSVCRLTGLSFAKVFLNAANELHPLRELLDGREEGLDAGDMVHWLSSELNGKGGSLKAAACLFSPDGRLRVVCAESRSMFGLKVRHMACLVSDRGGTRMRLGHMVWGRRHKMGWIAEG